METVDDEEVYLTTKQVMGILDCSRQYVSKLRTSGVLSSYRRGREFLLSAKEVEDMLTKKLIVNKLSGATTHG